MNQLSVEDIDKLLHFMNKHQLSERYSLYLKFLLHSVCAVESITLQLSLMLYLELILLSCTSSVLVVNFNSR